MSANAWALIALGAWILNVNCGKQRKKKTMCEYLNKLKRIEIGEQKPFLEWYKDSECGIYFSDMPDIDNKNIHIGVMSEAEIKAAKKKPLYLKKEITVVLYDYVKNERYKFEIVAKYDYDGATISRFLWRLIGSKEDVRFKVASLVHDVLCENKHYVKNDRYFADKIFERCLFVGGTNALARFFMFHAVDNFQKFCGW